MTDPKNNTIDKANTCFEALGDITDLATEFGKYTTTTKLEKNYVQIADLNTKIGEYIGNSISDLDSKVETLETKLNALQSGLTSMLKSLVLHRRNMMLVANWLEVYRLHRSILLLLKLRKDL